MFGLQKIDFFYICRKYNILRVYCKNFRPKYEIFTKLQHIVDSALRPYAVSRVAAATVLPLDLLLSRYLYTCVQVLNFLFIFL